MLILCCVQIKTDDDVELWCEIMMDFVSLFLFSYAESVGAKHYHTSAKLNKGIEELFLDLCKSKDLTSVHLHKNINRAVDIF